MCTHAGLTPARGLLVRAARSSLHQATMPSSRKIKKPTKKASVMSGVSGPSCASVSSSSVTRNSSAASPEGKHDFQAPGRWRRAAPSGPPRRRPAAAPTGPPQCPRPGAGHARRGAAPRAVARPSERSSMVRATASSVPSLAPAAKPMPSSSPSIRISMPTASSSPQGSAGAATASRAGSAGSATARRFIC